MKTFKNTLLIGALLAGTSFAYAQDTETQNRTTTTTTTTVSERPVVSPDARIIDISDFDTNNDGLITIAEIGEHLFEIYDLDGNGAIDNVEFTTPRVVTMVPMEQETITVVHTSRDNGEETEEVTYTYDTFLRDTGLSQFDRDGQGLTAAEFLGQSFLETDQNRDNMITLNEWKAAYDENVQALRESEKYN